MVGSRARLGQRWGWCWECRLAYGGRLGVVREAVAWDILWQHLHLIAAIPKNGHIGVLGVRLQVRPRPAPLSSAAFSKILSPYSANKSPQYTRRRAMEREFVEGTEQSSKRICKVTILHQLDSPSRVESREAICRSCSNVNFLSIFSRRVKGPDGR